MFNSFSCRLLTDDYKYLVLFLPYSAMTEALEETAAGHQTKFDCKVWIAAEWLIRCGNLLHRELGAGEFLTAEDQAMSNVKPGPLAEGVLPISLERWNSWRSRLVELFCTKPLVGNGEEFVLSDTTLAHVKKAISPNWKLFHLSSSFLLREIPDLPSLQSFAFTSPVIYEAFQYAFSGSFTAHVKKSYAAFGLNLKEPIAAVRSKGLYYAYKKPEATALINAWGQNDAADESQSAQFTPIDKPRDKTETIELCYLYERLLFFRKDFETEVPKPEWMYHKYWIEELPLSLSLLEQHRLLRALCRLEIHANIFGPMEEKPFSRNSLFDVKKARYYNNWEAESESDDPHHEAASLFFGKMTHWEYEEMSSLIPYLKSIYTCLYENMHAELQQIQWPSSETTFPVNFHSFHLPPNSRMRLPLREITDMASLEFGRHRTASLVAYGPNFLYRLLVTDDSWFRRDMILANFVPTIRPWIFDGTLNVIDHAYQFCRWSLDPNNDLSVFESFWETLPPHDRPNPAWLDVLRNEVATHNMHGSPGVHIPSSLQLDGDWAVAIWDRERLQKWEDQRL
ncbi:hypothetical protein N7528_003609 [Penicillium herquei]|nr:hypothetical protein N7528_003609 [Penicillium herquei]